MRSLLTLFLCLLVTVALFAEAGRNVLNPPDRWREWLQVLVAQQLADTLGREVRVGQIEIEGATGVVAHDIAVAANGDLQTDELITARQIAINYDLMGILHGDVAPAAGIGRVKVEGLWARIERDESGIVNLTTLLPPGKPAPPEEGFQGVVEITDSTIRYVDRGVTGIGAEPLEVELGGLSATIDMRRLGWAQIQLNAWERLGRVAYIDLGVDVESATGTAWLDADISGINVAWWYGFFANVPGLKIDRGQADMRGTIAVVRDRDGRAKSAISVDAQVRDVSVRLAALGNAPMTVDADMIAMPYGVAVKHLDAWVSGAHVRAEGAVSDFARPCLDLTFEAETGSTMDLARLLPAAGAYLENLDVTGPLTATGTFSGPPSSANVLAELSIPGTVDFTAGGVTARAEDIAAQVNLLDLSAPNVRASAHVARAEPVGGEIDVADPPGPLIVSPIEDLTAEGMWANGSPVAHTSVHVARIAAGEGTIEDLRAEATIAGGIVDVSGLQARVIDAELTAEGVLDTRGEDGLWAWVQGEVNGLDVARIVDLPGVDLASAGEPIELAGMADAKFSGSWQGGEPDLVVAAAVAKPGYGEYALGDVRALARLGKDGVEVQGLRFADPAAYGWAEGFVPWEGDVAARFAVAGVDLEQVLGRFDVEDVRGEVWAEGGISGALDAPSVELSAQGFGLGYGEYEADAIVADVRADADGVTVESLYGSAGRVTVSLDGTVTDLQTAEGEYLPEDGTIDGRLRIGGPLDSHSRALAGIEDVDAEGAVRVEAQLGGTLHRPIVEGRVFARYGRFDTIATDAALLQMRLEGDNLEIERVMMQVGDAVLQGSGSVTSLLDDPFISARLNANDVVLQDLDVWRTLGLPLSGTVSLPYLSVEGPVDDLKGLAQISAQDMVLGNEEIGGVEAWVVLDNQSLLLRRTTLALAGGELSLAGQYRLSDQEVLPSRVELSHVSIPRLLGAGRHIAQTFADDPESKAPLSQQLASLSMRLRGTLDASVALEGTVPTAADPAAEVTERPTLKEILQEVAAEVQLGVTDASYDMKDMPDVQVRAEVTEAGSIALDVEATEGEALLTVAGTWDPEGQVDMFAEIFALDMTTLHAWLPEAARSVGGQVNLALQATGRDIAPELLGSFDIIDPAFHGAHFDLISAPLIKVADGRIDVDSLVLRAQEQEIFVDGQVPFDWETMRPDPAGAIEITARTEKADLGIFPPMIARFLGDDEGEGPLSQLTASGTVDTKVSVTGTFGRPALTGGLTVNEGTVNLPGAFAPLEEITLVTKFSAWGGDTLFELEEFSARADQIALAASGEARIVGFGQAQMHENQYDFQATVAADEQSIGEGLIFRKLAGGVRLHTIDEGRQLLDINEIGARLGGGTISLDGSVEVTSFLPDQTALNDWDLTLVIDNARPKYSSLFLGTLNGQVTMANPSPGEPVHVGGGIEIAHATIGLPPLGGEPGGQLMGMSPLIPAATFDLGLAIGPDVKFKGVGVTAPLEPTEYAVRLQGTPQRPVLTALVELQEGRATLPAGVLDVATAGVRLSVRPAPGTAQRVPPLALELGGEVWGTATRRITDAMVDGRQVGEVNLLLELSGHLPDGIQVKVQSQPPLAEEQIYALLGTEQLSGLLGSGESEPLGDVMSRQFVTALGAAFRHYIFQPFTEDLKKMLGLSMLEVNFAFDQPVQVKIGKYLVDDLLVTYEAGLAGTDQEWEMSVSYSVADRYKVTYQADQTNDNRLFVEYVRTF